MKASIVATRGIASICVLAAAVASCQRTAKSGGVPDTTFVSVMAALKHVHDAPGIDSATRAFKRDSILQRRGLKPAQLEAAARRLAQNPARAQTVWQAVERRAADTTRPKPATAK